jgi:hypothetical protein
LLGVLPVVVVVSVSDFSAPFYRLQLFFIAKEQPNPVFVSKDRFLVEN